MKKILIIVLIMILLLNKKEDIYVFKEENSNNLYEINLINNISTSNFEKHLSDFDIIWIKPKINDIYKDKIRKKIYYFTDKSIKENIDYFLEQFTNNLNDLGLRGEASVYKTSGILIEKIKTYASDEQIDNLKKKFNNIKVILVE